jgi:hypothetical protein
MMKQYVMLMSVLVWSGCIVAISFMESWLKFRAPGVTLPIGLGIGKLVFNVLNKMEWVFALILLIFYFFNKQQIAVSCTILFALAVWMLIMQTFWLLPALDARANRVISGKTLAASSLHWYFVAAEVIKVGSLIILGYQLFKGFKVRAV